MEYTNINVATVRALRTHKAEELKTFGSILEISLEGWSFRLATAT